MGLTTETLHFKLLPNACMEYGLKKYLAIVTIVTSYFARLRFVISYWTSSRQRDPLRSGEVLHE